ncbi:MAG: hypothetical protein Q4C44_04260 [bacterium]|nr:hypothetical protein [bacterium]
MLKKLLKYDLKWILKVEYIWSIITIILAILLRLTNYLNDSVITNIIKIVLTSLTITGMANILFNAIIRTWVRVKNNLYKDEAYLTHTLPVKESTILSSKILAGVLTMLFSVATITVTFFIGFYSKRLLEGIKTSLQIVATTLNSSVTNILIILAIILFLEITFILLVGVFGIIKGHRSNDNKIIKSVLTSGITYIIFSGVSLLIAYIYGLFNEKIKVLFTGNLIDYATLKIFLMIIIVIYTAYLIILYFLSQREFAKGVNID